MASIQKRVSKSGAVSYRVQVRLKGQPPQTASFERKTDARRWASKIETEMEEGRYFATSRAKQRTLGDLINRYISDILPRKPRSILAQKTQLEWWRNQLGDQELMSITSDDISSERNTLLKRATPQGGTLSPSSVNRYVAALGHAFSVAIKEWKWLERSPVTALKKLPEPKGRVRYLDEAERSKLIDACETSQSCLLYAIVIVALSTGARRGEILGLTWTDVDLNDGHVVFHNTKNGEHRGVPLKGHALDVIRDLKKPDSNANEFVFPNHAETGPIDIRTPWETAVKKAGLVDFRFHDLRHTAASYLAMGGATPHEIAEVLGHKSLEMTRRYAHLSKTHVSGVVERMNKEMFGK